MKIYRLEHHSSGMGPFNHRSSRQKHPPQNCLKLIKTEGKVFMPTLTDKPEIKELVKNNPKVVFGWSSQEKYDEMVPDPESLRRLGFYCKVYNATPLFVGSCGQVIFVR